MKRWNNLELVIAYDVFCHVTFTMYVVLVFVVFQSVISDVISGKRHASISADDD